MYLHWNQKTMILVFTLLEFTALHGCYYIPERQNWEAILQAKQSLDGMHWKKAQILCLSPVTSYKSTAILQNNEENSSTRKLIFMCVRLKTE